MSVTKIAKKKKKLRFINAPETDILYIYIYIYIYIYKTHLFKIKAFYFSLDGIK